MLIEACAIAEEKPCAAVLVAKADVDSALANGDGKALNIVLGMARAGAAVDSDEVSVVAPPPIVMGVVCSVEATVAAVARKSVVVEAAAAFDDALVVVGAGTLFVAAVAAVAIVMALGGVLGVDCADRSERKVCSSSFARNVSAAGNPKVSAVLGAVDLA